MSSIRKKNTRSLNRRLLRRIDVILVVAFVGLAVITVMSQQLSGQQSVQRENAYALWQFDNAVARTIDALAYDVVSLSSGSTLRNFGQAVEATYDQDHDLGRSEYQRSMLRLFDDLLVRHIDTYMAVRYVDRRGQVWGEAINTDQQVTVNTVRRESAITPALQAEIEDLDVGQVYFGEMTSQNYLSIYTPVTPLGNMTDVVGLVQLQVRADAFINSLVQAAGDLADYYHVILIDNQRRILTEVGTVAASDDVWTYLDNNSGAIDYQVLEDTNFLANFASAAQAISALPVEGMIGVDTPWRVVLVEDFETAVNRYDLLSVLVVSVYTIMLLVVLTLVRIFVVPVLRPVQSLRTLAQRLAGDIAMGETLPMIDSGDELGEISGAIGGLSNRLAELQEQLSGASEKHRRNLELTARIGREVATLHDVDVILVRAINRICEEFGYYHAQVFLVDDARMNAVLLYSRGEAGRKLLEQDFKIPVGSESVIGGVTGSGMPVIVQDTEGQPGHRFNPLLPETRAEMGLPLVSGDTVIGVLDIQSKEPNAFQETDLPVFTLLANQLSVAIVNTRLMNQSETRITQIDTLNRQLTHQAWESAHKRLQLERAYRYNLVSVEPEPNGDGVADIRVPISIRGQTIGEISAASDEDFTEGDRVILQAVANRVSLAIENARLFQETQISLTETSTLYELSRALNEANSLQDIIDAIIQTVVRGASGGQIWTFDESASRLEWLNLAADSPPADRQDLTGMRVCRSDHPFLNKLEPDRVALVRNAREDVRLDSGLKLILRRLQAEALVIIPLVVRGMWQGIISLQFAEPHTFGEWEGRIYTALIDQAGVTIDNRLLLQQTEEQMARNENLYAASRIINTAQNMQDLVYAAVATNSDHGLAFNLSLLEGELDETGWPTQARMVAQSDGIDIREIDRVYPIHIPAESPLRQREPEVITDDTPSNTNVPPPVKWIREQGNRFTAVFPLFSANQPIALFQVTSQELRELTSTHIEVYRALTGQMSSQIQIRKLLERTEEALDEARRLYLASNAIISAQDLDKVYEVAVTHLARPFVAQEPVTISVLIAIPEPVVDAPTLEYVYRWRNGEGGHNERDRIDARDYPYGRLTAETRTAISLEENDGLAQQLLTQLQVPGALVAPIRVRQRWFGVMVCESATPRMFDEQYQRFLMAVADQIALAVDNIRLFDEARSEARRALALAEAAQLTNEIGSVGDVREGLDRVFARVAEEGRFSRWMLLLFDAAQNQLQVMTSRMAGFETNADITYDLMDEIPITDAIRLDQVIIVNDMMAYPSLQNLDENERMQLAAFFGKHIAAPVATSDQAFGGLYMGRDLDEADVDERDRQLVDTLATQVALALENRRLFQQTQYEQQTLRSILETLPTGVLVLDPQTLQPLNFNQQVQLYLGREIDPVAPFTIEGYNLYRTGTQLHYPEAELPIFAALASGREQSVDDVAVIMDDIQIDLLLNAAPITDEKGNVTSIVAAFQDITNLRSLENTLQENLRETVSLYEAQRQLAEAATLDDVLDVVLEQTLLQQPADALILMTNEDGELETARFLMEPFDNPEILRPLIHPDRVLRMDDASEAGLMLATPAVLTLPLMVSMRDDPYGWIVVFSDETFTMDQDRVLRQLSDVASTAIDNRLLIQRQQMTVREVQALYNATNTISHAREVPDLADTLRQAVVEMESDHAAAYLDASAGLSDDTLMLFNLTGVDFDTLMAGLTIPERGLFIDDLNEVQQPAASHLLAAGVQAVAAVHLRPREAAGGYLVIAYNAPHRFTDNENRYMNTMADAASVKFNNIILFKQIQNALEETSVLYQANRALSDATTTADVLDVVVNYLVEPSISLVFIALLEGKDWQAPGASVRVAASWSESGVELNGVTLSPDQFPAWSLLASRDVLMIDDIENAPDLDDMVRIGVASLEARSLLLLPLRVSNREIGIIWISSSESHTYGEKELRVYRSFAEQASLSLEAAYLLAQTERRARQLQTSAEVSQSAGKILDLEVLLPQVVDLIQEAFGYDHVQVFLMDDEDEYAELRASTGEAGQQLLGVQHKLAKGSDSVIGRVTAKAEPQIALDTAAADVVHKPNPYLPLTRSEMALPLIIKERVVGALDVQSNESNAFNEEDVRALTTLAAQISVAIDNANLFEASQDQAVKMGFLFEVTSAAAAADTLNEALETVSDHMHRMLDALSVVVYLPQLYIDDFDHSFMTLKAVATAGTEQPLTEIEEIRLDGEHLLADVARQRQPYVVERVGERYLPVVDGARSAVVLPLVAAGDLIGLIVMEDRRTNAYNYDLLQLLLTMTGSLSAVVQSMQLLEQLQATNEQLRELDRIKSDFLANMSHELRTPLNSIIGFSRVMLKGIDGPLTEMQEQDLSTIFTSGQHLLTLINDVLDQAKIAANKMDLKADYFEVKPLLEGVRSIGIGLVKDKPINLLLEMASNMPAAYGDEVRTRQVLLNLLSNSAKFTEQGSITIRAYVVDSMIQVDVIDTGIGIAGKDLPLLFEAFRQVDSSLTRTQGGTGLGLPIAKSLIEMQGGEMRVASQVNMGSTFTITIPTEPLETDADGAPESEPALDELDPITHVDPPVRPASQPTIEVSTVAVNAPRFIQTKRDVLLIEDNKDMVDQFRRVLQREGFEVTTADHPAYTEAMVSNLRPTLLVMDVNFANGEGWNILERLKERDDTFDIPIIVVTLSDESERAYQLGAYSFIERPFMPEDLVEAVLAAEKESNLERILIIDDQPESVRLLEQLLNQDGTYRVFSAHDGKEGISMVARRHPDLIILDLRMPEMDGFAVLAELRSNPETASVPVMVVTGELNLNADEQAQLANIHVLYKTDISKEEYDAFVAGVRQHLNGSE